MDIQEAIGNYNQATIRLARLCGNNRFDLGPVVDRGGDSLQSE
jgi:hypothetical protein